MSKAKPPENVDAETAEMYKSIINRLSVIKELSKSNEVEFGKNNG